MQSLTGKGDVFFGGPRRGQNSALVQIRISSKFSQNWLKTFPNPEFRGRKTVWLIYNDIVYFFSPIGRTDIYSLIWWVNTLNTLLSYLNVCLSIKKNSKFLILSLIFTILRPTSSVPKYWKKDCKMSEQILELTLNKQTNKQTNKYSPDYIIMYYTYLDSSSYIECIDILWNVLIYRHYMYLSIIVYI